MSARVWSIAVAAWAGTVAAQAPAGKPAEANVVTLRTAGQPERRVQVLKTERLPDGKILSEVKDLATGATFSIADTKPLMSEPASLPVVAPAMPPMTAPPSQLPQAKPRNYDPLLANAASTPMRPATPEYPTLVGKIRGEKAVSAPVPPTGAKPQSAMNAALFGSVSEAPPQPMFGRSHEAGAAKSPPPGQGGLKAAVFGTPSPQAQPVETPTLMGKLFGDKPAAAPPVPQPVHVVRQPTNVIRPNAVPSLSPASGERGRGEGVQSNVSVVRTPSAPLTLPSAPTKPGGEEMALSPISTDAREPNFHAVAPKPMTMKQIEEMVKDLRMHHKPSQRLEAANALATCPMSGMVEVRQILAEASYRDPVPVVRAHCIDLLTKMQYDEHNYRQYVEGLVNDEEPAVQRAARAAVK